MIDRQDWSERAACRGVDPEIFWPVGLGPAALAQAAEAKQICARCPVRVECLQHALTRPEPDGIWGGLSEDERARHPRQPGLMRIAS